MKLVLNLLVLLASVSSFAETDVYFYGSTLNANVDSAEVSEKLYAQIGSPAYPAKNATVKSISSNDESSGLQCRESGIVGDIPYACSLWIKNADQARVGTSVYEADGFIHAVIGEDTGAKAIYEALPNFTTDDGKAWLRCTKAGEYRCEIVIKKTTIQYGR